MSAVDQCPNSIFRPPKRSNTLAPVFDNGNAFSNKGDDDHLETDPQAIVAKWVGGRSIYESDGHQLSNKNLFAQPIPGLHDSVERAVTRFFSKEDVIAELVMTVPGSHAGKPVCSEKRKQVYLDGMHARAAWLAEDFEIAVG